MPTRKRFTRRRRRRRKTMSNGTKALKMVRRMNRATETKFIDVQGSVLVDWNGVIFSNLLTPPQGLSDNERIGDRIAASMLESRQCLVANGAASVLRIIIYWNKEGNVQGVDDILATTGSTRVIISPYNYDKRSWFTVLLDRKIILQNPAAATSVKSLVRRVMLKAKKVVFDVGSGAINKNILSILYVSDVNPLDIADKTFVDFYHRTTYRDS